MCSDATVAVRVSVVSFCMRGVSVSVVVIVTVSV